MPLPDWYAEARRLRAEGWSLDALAERYGVVRTSMNAVVAGVMRKAHEINPPWHAQAREDRRQGLKLREIAEKHGKAFSTVANIVAGIPRGA